LSLSDPPLRGDDVMGVQRALAAAKIAVEQDGVYRSSTAAAVAHFQKEQGLNVDGIVDLVTRQRLGVGDTPR
jgi:peptidoglycan hydrolase-like protein with peptidoglycan-binding domain